MKRRPLDPKSALFPFACAALLLVGCILWPRTAYRRWRGPRLLSNKRLPREVREVLRRMGDGCAVEGGNRKERKIA